MLPFLMALSLLFQTAPSPQDPPLTHRQVAQAHQAGVTTQGLLNMITAHSSVAPATEEELLSLMQSGVPAEVVDAYRARMVPPPASPPPADPGGPDDPRLADIVRLVRTGLSQDLIARQIRSSKEIYRLSVNDLVYLKDNQIPEAVIGELIASASRPVAVAPPSPASFGPLLRMTGLLRKDAPGTLKLTDNRMEWLDGKKADRNFAVQLSSVKEAWLECTPRPQGNFCYAMGLELFNRDKYEFRDLSWESGGNEQVLAVFEALKKDHPLIVFHERVK
jgi:hypothetical protein